MTTENTTCLRIKDWDVHFENSVSRKRSSLRWVPIPNKHDGDGYTELVEGHPNGPAHYGAWVTITQVASKCQPRGTLLRDNNQPHDPQSLARKTRMPASLLAEAIERLVDPEIGWLERIDIETQVVVPPVFTDRRPPDDHPTTTTQPPDDQSCGAEEKRREEKGREGKGREKKGKEEKKPSCRSYRFDDQDHDFATWMLRLIKETAADFKQPNLEAWAQDTRLMREGDKRNLEDARVLFQWAHDDEFWRSNILCPKTLRKQWDRLTVKMGANPNDGLSARERRGVANSQKWLKDHGQ